MIKFLKSLTFEERYKKRRESEISDAYKLEESENQRWNRLTSDLCKDLGISFGTQRGHYDLMMIIVNLRARVQRLEALEPMILELALFLPEKKK
jgi:hypothetical protein